MRISRNVASTLISLLVLVLPAAGWQLEKAPTVDEWVSEPGALAETEGGVTSVRRGTLRTARLYSDFILRFQFRLLAPTAEGRVLLRSRFGYGRSERGYRVALTHRRTGAEALGRIAAAAVRLGQVEFVPAQLTDRVDGWQDCEIRADRGRLMVKVNGETVSSADGLDEFTGHVALQARQHEIHFRNLMLERLPSAGEPFGHGAYRGDEPGVTLPQPVKRTPPFYPREPHDAGIQGIVGLELIVDAKGVPGDVRVVKSLDPDLDEAAIGSARQWQFTPGMRAGQAVPVIITLDMSFRRTQ